MTNYIMRLISMRISLWFWITLSSFVQFSWSKILFCKSSFLQINSLKMCWNCSLNIIKMIISWNPRLWAYLPTFWDISCLKRYCWLEATINRRLLDLDLIRWRFSRTSLMIMNSFPTKQNSLSPNHNLRFSYLKFLSYLV